MALLAGLSASTCWTSLWGTQHGLTIGPTHSPPPTLFPPRRPQREYVLDFIVERKSIDDLIGSIKGSNRYEKQKVQCRACRLCGVLCHLWLLAAGWGLGFGLAAPGNSWDSGSGALAPLLLCGRGRQAAGGSWALTALCSAALPPAVLAAQVRAAARELPHRGGPRPAAQPLGAPRPLWPGLCSFESHKAACCERPSFRKKRCRCVHVACG